MDIRLPGNVHVGFGMDSGAHSIETFITRKDISEGSRSKLVGYSGSGGKLVSRGTMGVSIRDKDFSRYVDWYIDWLHEVKHGLDMYVSVDLIGDAKASWDSYWYMVDAGLDPVPVYHHGEDLKWLKKYVDAGCSYVGISGVSKIINRYRYQILGDRMFDIICDRHGTPRVKVHGFAANSPALLHQYPFYSADSSAWCVVTRTGQIFVPHCHGDGKYSYRDRRNLKTTMKSDLNHKEHMTRTPKTVLGEIEKWLMGTVGMTLADTADEFSRTVVNFRYMSEVERSLKKHYRERFGFEEGGNVMLAGELFSTTTPAMLANALILAAAGKRRSFRFLGTPLHGGMKRGINIAEVLRAKDGTKDIVRGFRQRAPSAEFR